jgi:hypothetical protein
MAPLRASVQNGRLVLDDPSDIPDSEVVNLQLVEGFVAVGADDLDEADRSALHTELEASIREADSGQAEDFAKVLAELRSPP